MLFSGGNTQGGSYYRAFALSLSGAGEINVLNNLTFTPSGNLRLNGGTINLYGNLNATAAGMYSGTTKIRFASASDQEYEVAGGALPHFVVDKQGGAVTPVDTKDLSISSFELLAGNFFAPTGMLTIAYPEWGNYDIFKVVDGNFYHNNGTLRFSTSSTTQSDRSSTIRLNKALELNNLSFISGHSGIGLLSYVISLNNGATLHVLGNLAINPSASRYFKINSGAINLNGDYLVNTGSAGGSVTIALIGSMDQSVTHAGGTPPQGALTINKPAGAVCLATPLTLSGSTQDISWQSGDLSLGTNTLFVGRHLSIGESADKINVTIAEEGVAGRITVTGIASGIGNATLCVDAPRSVRDDTKDRTYTILSNNTALSDDLASVIWTPPWHGKISYTENSGKNITIYDFMYRYPGTVLAVQ